MGSRLVLGASTLALVLVASGGTAILVTQGTQLSRTPLAIPSPALERPRPTPTPLVVPRAPGSALFGPSQPAAPPAAPPAQPVVEVPDVVAVPPVVAPPAVVPEPPVVGPPVVEPPVVEPPVVEPPTWEPPTSPGRGTKSQGRGTKSNNGHHYGQIKHPKDPKR